MRVQFGLFHFCSEYRPRVLGVALVLFLLGQITTTAFAAHRIIPQILLADATSSASMLDEASSSSRRDSSPLPGAMELEEETIEEEIRHRLRWTIPIHLGFEAVARICDCGAYAHRCSSASASPSCASVDCLTTVVLHC